MQVRKAVITAAGRGVRLSPAADTVEKAMLPFVDRDGLNKPVLQIIAEEAFESGIEEICVVCAPGDERRYQDRFERLRSNLEEAYKGVDWALKEQEKISALLRRLEFAPQEEPLGYGHAVYCARKFVGEEPFLLLLGDHLYISALEDKRCAQQIIDLADAENCPVAAIQATRESMVGRYGTLSGKRVASHPGVYQIEKILEKPSLSQAETELHVPGLRLGYYLCFFGMNVLPPSLFGILERHLNAPEGREGGVLLTPALQELAEREKYLALEVKGSRYDIGARYGLLQSQLALGLAGKDRDEVLTTVVETLAEANQRQDS